MKINKNLIALFVIAALAFAMSCEENVAEPVNEASGTSMLGDSTMTDDWQEVAIADLPQSILDFIAEEYGDEEIIEAWLTDEGEYIIVLDDDLYLIFDNTGAFVEEYDEKEHRGDRDPIDISELPQSVLDYIAANHPDAEIKKAFTNEDGEIIVKLNNRMVVIFDSEGNFIEEFEKERRQGDDDLFDDWDEVSTESLPQAILDYISTNYPDDEIIIAGINEDGEYGVILSSEIILIFDSDGNFLESFTEDDLDDEWDDDHDYEDCNEISYDDLPQAAKDYLTENHPNDEIEGVWFDEEEQEYIVELSSDVYVIFDIDGNHIETEECDD